MECYIVILTIARANVYAGIPKLSITALGEEEYPITVGWP